MKRKIPQKTLVYKQMITDFKQTILSIAGEKVKKIVLFGSYARGDFSSVSDIDVLLITQAKADKELENKLIDYEVDFSLKYGKLLQILIYDDSYYNEFQQVSNLFYNANKEGILLYGE